MDSPTIKHAKLIWNYLASFNQHRPSDAIVVCCSYDLRVCDYACELQQKLHVPRIVFTGNTGNWTGDLWDQPEARIFKKRTLLNGIKSSEILNSWQYLIDQGFNLHRMNSTAPD